MKIRLARLLALGSYLGLIAFGMAWSIRLGGLPKSQISFSLLMYAPLLVPLRGILHERDKALVWGTLVALIYLVHGGMTAWADPGHRLWGLLELLLSIVYIGAASFFIRWRARQNATA